MSRVPNIYVSNNSDKNVVIPNSISKDTQDDITCFKFLETAFH